MKAEVVRVKPAQASGRGQSTSGHLERVATATTATASRGALQVSLSEQRAWVVSGQRQLSIEQQIGGGAERRRAKRTAQARATGVHARVQVRQ